MLLDMPPLLSKNHNTDNDYDSAKSKLDTYQRCQVFVPMMRLSLWYSLTFYSPHSNTQTFTDSVKNNSKAGRPRKFDIIIKRRAKLELWYTSYVISQDKDPEVLTEISP